MGGAGGGERGMLGTLLTIAAVCSRGTHSPASADMLHIQSFSGPDV